MKVIRPDEIPIEQRQGYVIKRLFTEKLHFKPENIGLYQTIIPPGSRVKKHCHEKLDEIMFFLTPGKILTDNGMISLGKGDFIIFGSGEFHEILADETEVRLIAMKIPNIIDDRIESY